MKTLRMIRCPLCDHSTTPRALAERTIGRFKADVRACEGRKGLPHVAWEDLTRSERELLKQRFLTAIQAAFEQGIIDKSELRSLARADVPPSQIPMAIRLKP